MARLHVSLEWEVIFLEDGRSAPDLQLFTDASDDEVPEIGPTSRHSPYKSISEVRSDISIHRRSLDNLGQETLAPATWKVYQTGVRVFMTFLTMHSMYSTSGLPVLSELWLSYFLSHCHYNLQIRYSMIKSYLGGIRFHYLRAGVSNPWTDNKMLHVNVLLHAIQCLQGISAPCRLPITMPVLRGRCAILRRGLFSHYTDGVLFAVYTTAFFAFLRCGEFTTDP